MRNNIQVYVTGGINQLSRDLARNNLGNTTWRQKLKCSWSNIFLQKNPQKVYAWNQNMWEACHLMTAKNSVFIIYQGSSVSKKSIILNISPNMLCEFGD